MFVTFLVFELISSSGNGIVVRSFHFFSYFYI